jgi:outer membrane protein assembly factor BamD
LFLKFDSYQLGINSVPAKMEERLNVAKQHMQFDKVQKQKQNTKSKI